MDIHKLAQDVYEAGKHWHLPLFFSLLGSVGFPSKMGIRDKNSDLGDAPGDNILPSEILISLSSRKGPGSLLYYENS
ncbi:MAG: hypothetical protein Q8N85_02195 [Candidatus Omnitrophota bacterium]|nr:hypothetical protein [Candidatus Omnitrophota bacterium]